MKYFESPIWNEETGTDIQQLIEKMKPDIPSQSINQAVQKHWDEIAKPIDGLGRFEKIVAKIASILEDEQADISKKAVLIMCADNGIVDEKISQSGREVTLAVARSMGRGMSSVCKMAQTGDIDILPIDIGIDTDEKIEGVMDLKVRAGTRNFRNECAMSREEMLQAIQTGINLVYSCREAGYKLLATGEMGIGNTTTSSACAAALLRCPAKEMVGRGAGASDQMLAHKKEIVQQAIDQYGLYEQDAWTILQAVGGLDIAGLVGVCLGGAIFHIPIVLDGVISMTAALLAEKMLPGSKEYWILSHQGKEPATTRLASEIGQVPILCAELALGEGTGAVLMMKLLDTVMAVYETRTLFADIDTEQYQRYV